MSKKIILLSDGTGNSAGKANKTNVWRLYRALDLQNQDRQIAFYDDGVGTQAFLPLKILGGVFGWGLKRNVIELYEFLCRNYDDGDKIYLFGFSRGAFTIRMLVGLIHCCGVIREKLSEEALHKEAKRRYEEDFRKHFKLAPTRAILSATQAVKDFTEKSPGKKKASEKKDRDRIPAHKDAPEMEFVGVWDTVSAYGMPIDELTRFWNLFVHALSFPDQGLSSRVLNARHALSIDDERKTFHPVLWDEKGNLEEGRIKQVWFAGAHSNIGGGYPKDELSLVTLNWMMSEIENLPVGSRLHFFGHERERIRDHAHVHGTLYDSRKGVSTYYRLKPRNIEDLCHKKVTIDIPKIHESVFERIKGGVTPYAPLGIPKEYEIIPKLNFETKSSKKGASVKAKTTPLIKAEKPGDIDKRWTDMEDVWKIVTERVGLYWLFLWTTVFLVVFPVYINWAKVVPKDVKGDFIDKTFSALETIVPGYLGYFVESWSAYPYVLGGTIVVLLVLMRVKNNYLIKTKNRSEEAWGHLKKNNPGKSQG